MLLLIAYLTAILSKVLLIDTRKTKFVEKVLNNLPFLFLDFTLIVLFFFLEISLFTCSILTFS